MSGQTPDVSRALVDRARHGEEAALRSLVEAVYSRVHRWALVHTGDPADADDLTQDVLVLMIRKLDTFRAQSRFTTWLYALTRNTAIDRRRGAQRRERLVEEVHEQTGAAESPDPSRDAEQRELGHTLLAFFRELPTRQREVFELVELEGRSAGEVAEMLEVEPASVRAHLFKARRRLRGIILAARPDLVEDLG